MRFMLALFRVATPLVCVVALGCGQAVTEEAAEDATAPAADATSAPNFRVDPFWPKPLPNDWLMGEIAGLAVDERDHVWVNQRPRSLSADELGAAQDPPISICCMPAPQVLEFDPEGNLVQSWGGPGEGYEWPGIEHGLFVDHDSNVWVAGEAADDHYVLKFTSTGSFLLQIGEVGQTGGNSHTEFLGHPAAIEVGSVDRAGSARSRLRHPVGSERPFPAAVQRRARGSHHQRLDSCMWPTARTAECRSSKRRHLRE